MEYIDFSSLTFPSSVVYSRTFSYSDDVYGIFSEISTQYDVRHDIISDFIEFVNKYFFQLRVSDVLRNTLEVEYLVFAEDRNTPTFYKQILYLKGMRGKFDVYSHVSSDYIICIVRSIKYFEP